MILPIVILCISIGFLIVERMIVNKSVTAINLRVHVNGTRGKSSVTEYIAAGLLSPDANIISKITGVIPAVGSGEKKDVLFRLGVARVQEQFDIMRYAARKKADSMVLECMSVSPELQQLESRIFKPHIYVITNIKDDHREVMGNTIDDQARSICRAIPNNCRVVTSESNYISLIRETAEKKNSLVVLTDIPDKTCLRDLPGGVFSDNVALALTVCREAGLDMKKATERIISFIEKTESPLFTVRYGEKEISFLNGFPVNDIDSTRSFIDHWRSEISYERNYSVLLNTRADRPFRTDQLVGLINEMSVSIDHVFISGTHFRRAASRLKNSFTCKNRIHRCKKTDIPRIKKIIADRVPDKSLVIGIGNIGGGGSTIIEMLK